MTRAKEFTDNISHNVNTQIMLFRVLIIGSVLLFVVYIYLVGSITFNVIARKSLENTVVVITSNINNLELTYLSNINKIDKDYAISKGFVEVHQNIFAARDINHVAIR
jgi:hypothetical protein